MPRPSSAEMPRLIRDMFPGSQAKPQSVDVAGHDDFSVGVAGDVDGAGVNERVMIRAQRDEVPWIPAETLRTRAIDDMMEMLGPFPAVRDAAVSSVSRADDLSGSSFILGILFLPPTLRDNPRFTLREAQPPVGHVHQESNRVTMDVCFSSLSQR